MTKQMQQKIQDYKIKFRKLLDGSQVEDFDYPIDLIIHTKAPEKWKIIDMETGQEYVGNSIPHPVFSEILKQRVSIGKIGQWKKTKGRKNAQQTIIFFTYT